MNHIRHYALIAALSMSLTALAQESGKQWRLTGAVQSDVLLPQRDDVIGAERDNWALTNTYAELSLINKYFEAGVRYEGLQHPLPGFERDFKGRGIPFYYAKGKYKGVELTAGSFYEQFGSGFVLRTYEERSLGIDNSLQGGRLVVNSLKGVRVKALGGKQRRYWDTNDSWVWGADLELSLDDWFPRMQAHNTYLTLGGSFVSRHEDEDNLVRVESGVDADGMPTLNAYSLNQPENVGAYDVRANLRTGNYNFLVEYAQKGQDPSFDNGYIYRKGNALLFSGSYSKRGMSVLLQAKRSEDMSFRSRRSMTGTSSFINHLPAFSMQQTYALATIYPYATQMALGEWAFQAELAYTFKRRTALGGKYGTSLKMNFSHIRSLDKEPLLGEDGQPLTGQVLWGTEGYKTHFGCGGEIYYQDFNVQLEKKVSKDFKLNLMYLNQRYNKTIVEGEGGTIKSHIAVAEGKYNISKKVTLRAEAQYLHTKQDQKDWWFGLLELTVLPKLMFTISDQYNAHVLGADGNEHKVHYYMGQVTISHKAHRLQLGYGKTRAGYNCSGGVCRYVPAQKGVQASYILNF